MMKKKPIKPIKKPVKKPREVSCFNNGQYSTEDMLRAGLAVCGYPPSARDLPKGFPPKTVQFFTQGISPKIMKHIVQQIESRQPSPVRVISSATTENITLRNGRYLSIELDLLEHPTILIKHIKKLIKKHGNSLPRKKDKVKRPKAGHDPWEVYRRKSIEGESLEAITKDLNKLSENPSVDPLAMQHYQRERSAYKFAEKAVDSARTHPRAFAKSVLSTKKPAKKK